MNSNEKLNATELTLLKMLWQMPHACAWDLKDGPSCRRAALKLISISCQPRA